MATLTLLILCVPVFRLFPPCARISPVWSLVLCHMVSDTSVPYCVSCVVLRAAVREGCETGVPRFTNFVHRHTNTLVEVRPRMLMTWNTSVSRWCLQMVDKFEFR